MRRGTSRRCVRLRPCRPQRDPAIRDRVRTPPLHDADDRPVSRENLKSQGQAGQAEDDGTPPRLRAAAETCHGPDCPGARGRHRGRAGSTGRRLRRPRPVGELGAAVGHLGELPPLSSQTLRGAEGRQHPASPTLFEMKRPARESFVGRSRLVAEGEDPVGCCRLLRRGGSRGECALAGSPSRRGIKTWWRTVLEIVREVKRHVAGSVVVAHPCPPAFPW